jgi:hypothetical protein
LGFVFGVELKQLEEEEAAAAVGFVFRVNSKQLEEKKKKKKKLLLLLIHVLKKIVSTWKRE